MLKELTPTDSMISALAACSGGPVDTSKIAIFECIALNTAPVGKRGSIYEGAVSGKGMLADMAAFVEAGNFVKLHTLHEQGMQLPVGNVFEAELIGEELRALFYIGRDTPAGQDLIANLNNSIIDEVSCGVRPKALRCSECGWDYFGPDADIMNLFDRTCANGHTIGTEGVHAKLEGLDRWLELSLVSIGAANGAKIVGRAKSLLGADEYQRLAASGVDPEITTLFAVGGKVSNPPKKEAIMADENTGLSASAVMAQFTEMTTAKVTADLALKASAEQVTTLTAQLAETTAKVTTLEAKVAEASEGVKLKDEHGKLLTFLSEQTKAALVASGSANPQVPETVDAMLAALNESKLKLHNLPVGQVMEGSAEESSKTMKNPALAAFKIN